MINVVLYGFGNISHALIAELKNKNFNVTVLTSSMKDKNQVKITNINTGNTGIANVSSSPQKCLKEADYLIFCVPSHIRKESIQNLKIFIKPETIIGAFPGISGFDEEAKELLPDNKSIFSAQRVPFISRVLEKGALVNAEVKMETNVAITSGKSKKILEQLEQMLGQRISCLPSFDLINLTNSNPLLHTARIYDFLVGGKYPYEINENQMFYRQWTNRASEVLIQMDQEFQEIILAKGLSTPTVLEHYDVKNAEELTYKLSNITAFQEIKFPAVKKNIGWVVDFNSRYFVEDFELGLKYTIEQGKKEGVNTNTMEKVFREYENAKNIIKSVEQNERSSINED